MKPEALFKRFDANQDVAVTREEFSEALDAVNDKARLTERQILLIVNQADKNRNNKIEYEEFVDLLATINFKGEQSSSQSGQSTKVGTGVKKVTILDSGLNVENVDGVIKKLQEFAQGNFRLTFSDLCRKRRNAKKL